MSSSSSSSSCVFASFPCDVWKRDDERKEGRRGHHRDGEEGKKVREAKKVADERGRGESDHRCRQSSRLPSSSSSSDRFQGYSSLLHSYAYLTAVRYTAGA